MSERQPGSDRFGIAPATGSGLGVVDPAELSRYDLLLATMAVVLLVGWLVGRVSSVPLPAALAAAGLSALPLLADGLAVNPPR